MFSYCLINGEGLFSYAMKFQCVTNVHTQEKVSGIVSGYYSL